MSKFIKFIEYTTFGKTSRFRVANKISDSTLAWIKWYGPFRKYSFYPEPDIVFDAACLQDILTFINNLEDERKAKIQSRRQSRDR